MKKLDCINARTMSAAAAAVLGLLAPAGARAADIVVETDSMAITQDSICGFAEAVEAVNTQAPFNGCDPGDGNNDRIVLGARTFQTFNTVAVARDVEIVGAGIDQTNFNTGGALGLRMESGTGFPISVKVRDLTIRDVHPSLPVTCVFVAGGAWLNLDRVRVTGCSSSGGRRPRDRQLQLHRSEVLPVPHHQQEHRQRRLAAGRGLHPADEALGSPRSGAQSVPGPGSDARRAPPGIRRLSARARATGRDRVVRRAASRRCSPVGFSVFPL